jgi:hypothetical protein
MVVDDVGGAPESAIAAVRILDGTETCIVGFLPRSMVLRRGRDFIGCFDSVNQIVFQIVSVVLRLLFLLGKTCCDVSETLRGCNKFRARDILNIAISRKGKVDNSHKVFFTIF